MYLGDQHIDDDLTKVLDEAQHKVLEFHERSTGGRYKKLFIDRNKELRKSGMPVPPLSKGYIDNVEGRRPNSRLDRNPMMTKPS